MDAQQQPATSPNLSIDDLLERIVARGASDIHVTTGQSRPSTSTGSQRAPDRRACRRRRTAAPVPDPRPSSRSSSRSSVSSISPTRSRASHASASTSTSSARASAPPSVSFPPRSRSSKTSGSRSSSRALEEAARPRAGQRDRPARVSRRRSRRSSTRSNSTGRPSPIRDPIEFLHRHKKCVVNQREIGPDAASYSEALRGAAPPGPRRDPRGRDARPRDDRDRADGGRDRPPVATLHAGRPSTVDRLIDVFRRPAGAIRVQIASTLQAVVTQTLVPTVDGKGRLPTIEILFPTARSCLIRQGEVEQIYSIMQTGTARGMQTLEQARRPGHARQDLARRGAHALEPARSARRAPQARRLRRRRGDAGRHVAGSGAVVPWRGKSSA